jgi:CheY-like chemotaxis protein
LIYLDIEMPGMDGQEVLRQIKSRSELRDIPVVMMTGVSDEEQMRQAALNGANSYTLKPASAEQFIRTVLESTNYWMCIHQYPDRHLDAGDCRR